MGFCDSRSSCAAPPLRPRQKRPMAGGRTGRRNIPRENQEIPRPSHNPNCRERTLLASLLVSRGEFSRRHDDHRRALAHKLLSRSSPPTMPLFSRKQGDDEERREGQNRPRADDDDDAEQPPPDEHTRLLPNRVDSTPARHAHA
ncbi:hypothetical protein ACCO45_003353 [Purpureocillium lilacinum]|uniref:Uncharacterized protein n=1 Tax=Purpureocillium lilacinum TaxID=33203 RepID=A0ACC4DZM0_PURLI